MTVGDMRKLRAAADAKGLGVSAYVRMLLTEHLAALAVEARG
jgi:hypothetical protein